MQTYTPELGQLFFGQPALELQAPGCLIDALKQLGRTMVKRNYYRGYGDTPFANSGEQFKNDTFQAHAYSWSDEEQPWNFRYRDIRVSWYKHAGRGVSVNRAVTEQEVADMLRACIESL